MLRIWLRSWRRKPLLATQYVLTISIGIGATVAVLSLMLALGYEPLPYPQPSQLVAVWERVQSGSPRAAISGPDLSDLSAATTSAFRELGAFIFPRLWIRDGRGAQQVVVCSIEESALRGLDIRPVLGRGVIDGDMPAGGSATAPIWISSRLWHARYGESPSVIGATIGLASNAAGLSESRARIVGVFPARASLPFPSVTNPADVWMILSNQLKADRPRSASLFFGVGRLQPGVSVARAQAELTAAGDRLSRQFAIDRRKRPVVESLEAIAQAPARRTMGLLGLAAALVFVLGCANLAILTVAESGRRRRELAVRASLGASRWRLWSVAAGEYGLMAAVSTALGVAVASALLRALSRLVPAAGIAPPLTTAPPLDMTVMLASSAFVLVAALSWSGLLVISADTGRSAYVLAAGNRLGFTGLGDPDRNAKRFHLLLVAAQSGIGVCLLAMAVLAAKTYASLSRADLGPSPRRTVLLAVHPRDVAALSDAQASEFGRDIVARFERLPGARIVALADAFPPPAIPMPFTRQGDSGDETREATYPVSVSPDYFRALGIRMLFGRGFADTDEPDSEQVAIISQDVAERNWASPEDAVGASIAVGSRSQTHYRIVGVAANFTGYWTDEPVPTIYLPLDQSPSMGGVVVLQTTGAPERVEALAPQALQGMSTPALISDVGTMEGRWLSAVSRPLARMVGMIVFALLAIGLSMEGVYASVAATLAARRHELAVRSALGAPAGRLAWSITRDIAAAALVGAGLGVVAALDLGPVLAGWIGSTGTRDVATLGIAVALLALTAATGCYVPARAAARANPAAALRLG
ncbi:MAG: ABC transporter permease [Vicinamibacterales bacterium]